MRILVIDNYDSFVYNLVQYLAQLGAECVVRRNDMLEVGDVGSADAVLLSPGPGTPERAGVSMDVVRDCADQRRPLLGVCLGHQAIGVVWGATVARAPELLHGKTSLVHHDGSGVLAGLPTPFVASEAGPRTLVARVASGYCHGAPYRPSLERVALRWRSVSATRFAAELTAFVRTPVQPPSPRAGEGPDIIQVCAGIAYDLRAKVVLPQLLARTALFDASFAPPRRMQLHGHLWFATGAFLD